MSGEWLEDAFGPDGIRVTFRVERAVERLVRERDAWSSPGPFPSPVRSLLPRLVQTLFLKDRWVVDVEADCGDRVRLTRADRDEALRAAHALREEVQARGVQAVLDAGEP